MQTVKEWERGGCRPVKDATRCQCLTGLQWTSVDGELHDAAHKVVGGDLTTAVKDGFYRPDAADREPVRVHIQDPVKKGTQTSTFSDIQKLPKCI